MMNERVDITSDILGIKMYQKEILWIIMCEHIRQPRWNRQVLSKNSKNLDTDCWTWIQQISIDYFT